MADFHVGLAQGILGPGAELMVNYHLEHWETLQVLDMFRYGALRLLRAAGRVAETAALAQRVRHSRVLPAFLGSTC